MDKNSATTTSKSTFPLASILTIIFVIAKLTGYITWSWIWVFSPLWISGLLVVGVLFVMLLFAFIVALFY